LKFDFKIYIFLDEVVVTLAPTFKLALLAKWSSMLAFTLPKVASVAAKLKFPNFYL
jgi:hypothetical protein